MAHQPLRYTECSSAAILRKLQASWQTATPSSYPSVSSIPHTSSERLARAAENATDKPNADSATVLYLAYGSNLCAQTFLGMRGIRPLSQTNVSVPTLRLTFSLPGQPYREPCFANVDFRKPPKQPELPDPINPGLPPINPPHAEGAWDAGLIGVVYEVTQEDYGKIIRTEGGGAGYHEIAVPCFPIPPKMGIPEKPPYPELPRPFLAKTLFAPYLPLTDTPDDPSKYKWWQKLVVLHGRPSPDYAQPSLRYLNLLRDGAREHDLPDAYQAYLRELQPYTITSVKQEIGKLVYQAIWGPLMLLLVQLMALVADEQGNAPDWLVVAMTVMINLEWLTYDMLLKPVFGDGEKTQDEDARSQGRGWRGYCAADEEKLCLMREEAQASH